MVNIKDEDEENIKNMYLIKEMSPTQIGEKLGVSPGSIIYHLNKMKVKMRSIKDYSIVSPVMSQDMIDRYLGNNNKPKESITSIAQSYNVTNITVKYWLKKAGVYSPPDNVNQHNPGILNGKSIARLIDLSNKAKCSPGAIADILDISDKTVCYRLEQAGVIPSNVINISDVDVIKQRIKGGKAEIDIASELNLDYESIMFVCDTIKNFHCERLPTNGMKYLEEASNNTDSESLFKDDKFIEKFFAKKEKCKNA